MECNRFVEEKIGETDSAEFREHRKQIESGEFIGRDNQLALVQGAEFDQRLPGVGPQIQHSLGVLLEHSAGIGEQPLARGAIKERLPDLLFQLANGLTDRRLGTIEFFRGPRKATLPGHGEKDLELT